MESTQGLKTAGIPEPDSRTDACNACGVAGSASPPVEVDLFGGVALCRCIACGTRRPAAPVDLSPARSSRFAGTYGLPRLEGGEVVEPMSEGAVKGAPPEPGLAEATEREMRRVLARRRRFVSGPRSSEYLDRLARCAARGVEGAPEDCRVLLLDDVELRRLALPSGSLILSVGALRAVEDEAELVFVLGHELAHVTSGDAARRLVELGLVELARGEGDDEDAAWLRAMNDLCRLGHGPENEHRADLQGLRAVLTLGYEPESVIRYLERLGRAVEQGEAGVAETTLAHPLPADRLARVRRSWGARLRDPGASRVNRDAFRRALGHSALAAELRPCDPPPEEHEARGDAMLQLPWKDWRFVGTGVAILLLTALILVLGLLLAR